MKPTQNTQCAKLDMKRMKDIISQLTDIIYILCRAKKSNITMILDQFTDITEEELNSLHIFFPTDSDD